MTRGLALAAFALVSACGRDSAATRGESASAAGASSTMGAAAATSVVGAAGDARRALCPKTGHWSACLVKERLDRNGLAPQPSTSGDDLPPIAGPAPERYMVGNSVLAIYVFADSMLRRRAAAALDKAKFIPPTREVGMKGEATAIENDNVLALLFSRNELQRERVSDAITAGPPQP